MIQTSHFDGWDLKNDHFGTLFGPFLRGPKQVSSAPIRTWRYVSGMPLYGRLIRQSFTHGGGSWPRPGQTSQNHDLGVVAF